MKQQLLLIFFSLLFFSCLNEDSKTIWVYPYLLNESYPPYAEAGIFFLTQESENLDYSRWNRRSENFEIKGFDFEEGNFYKLKVEVQESNPAEKLKMKAILEKNKDYIERVEGTWISVEITGVPFIQTYFRINKVTRTFITSGGCASLLLGLGEVGVKKIQLADHTYRLDMDKICLAQNPGVSGSFSWITKVVEYKKNSEGNLDFFDEQGNLFIRFKPYE
ncbi:hypothetical protein SAMN03080617_04096 [Algoriphagus alkaliphilus]|uniref:DUF4377 domain-containing protein n=1 Tax=Algoriphagus alkaliphilus TaxID=279824 RepID=A0A1G5ZLK8_9BACT|nr:hypothetical protein [Algoriphagus alkaliphilus]SDA95545.1 hypothetical protein SAMN03080617_04096 [Algoriphagus alkaliphilus]